MLLTKDTISHANKNSIACTSGAVYEADVIVSLLFCALDVTDNIRCSLPASPPLRNGFATSRDAMV